MAIYRKAAKRDKNESEIVTALRSAGASVFICSGVGLPDLVVGFRGTTHLLEVKSTKGKLTVDQVDSHSAWQGSPIHIVRNVEQALISIGAI